MERGSQIVESKVNFKSNPKLSPPPFNTWVANPAAKTRLPFGFLYSYLILGESLCLGPFKVGSGLQDSVGLKSRGSCSGYALPMIGGSAGGQLFNLCLPSSHPKIE